MQVYLRAL